MARNSPDDENCWDWINKGEHQTTVERDSCPQWCWRFEPEGARDQSSICSTCVAEEAVYGAEESR
jgi:hypothetical protein